MGTRTWRFLPLSVELERDSQTPGAYLWLFSCIELNVNDLLISRLLLSDRHSHLVATMFRLARPSDQLYCLRSRHRRLSYHFISWFVLGQNIQMETNDLIEDVRSALRWYKVYNEFEEWGVFDEILEELYRARKQHVRD